MGKQWKQWQTLFSWAPKSLKMVTAAMKLKDTCCLEEKLWPTKTAYSKAETLLCFVLHCFSSQGYGFCSSHVWMWELECKESWKPKNSGFWTVVLERTLESPLDCKKIQPVHPKGNQSWIFSERTDAEAETPVLWPPDVKNDSFEKTLILGKMKAGGEGDDRGWDGWMASLTQWAWVWVNSRSWWWTGRPGVLQSMGSQRVRHDWETDVNWTDWFSHIYHSY